MKTQFNEVFLYDAVKSGELKIDHQGRIWRLKKRSGKRWQAGTRLTKCPTVRAESFNGRYLQVKVMRKGVRKYAAAARLVWHHFKGAIPPGLTVNHKDGKKTNNRPNNLELATPKQQTQHLYQKLGFKATGPVGTKNWETHLTDQDVIQIRQRRAKGESIQALRKAYSISRNAAWMICTGRTWKHLL